MRRASSVPMLQKRVDDQLTISRQMVRDVEEVFHAHLKRVVL